MKAEDKGVRLKVDSSWQQIDGEVGTQALKAAVSPPSPPPPRSASDAVEQPSTSKGFAAWFDEQIGLSEPNRCQATLGEACKIGCRCSLLRVCLPRPHVSPHTDGAHSEGICSMDASKVAALMGMVVFVGWLLLKLCGSKRSFRRKVADKLTTMLPIDSAQLHSVLDCVAGAEAVVKQRKELERRLRSATPMSVSQSQVLLGHFFNFTDHSEELPKKKRREIRARLAAQREYHFDSIEMETLPQQENQEATVKKL